MWFNLVAQLGKDGPKMRYSLCAGFVLALCRQGTFFYFDSGSHFAALGGLELIMIRLASISTKPLLLFLSCFVFSRVE